MSALRHGEEREETHDHVSSPCEGLVDEQDGLLKTELGGVEFVLWRTSDPTATVSPSVLSTG